MECQYCRDSALVRVRPMDGSRQLALCKRCSIDLSVMLLAKSFPSEDLLFYDEVEIYAYLASVIESVKSELEIRALNTEVLREQIADKLQ